MQQKLAYMSCMILHVLHLVTLQYTKFGHALMSIHGMTEHHIEAENH